MFEPFLKNNLIDKNVLNPSSTGVNNFELEMLFQECGGVSIKGGLYKVHTADSCLYWSDILNKYFPDYGGHIYPFGFDWLGRQYCINIVRKGFITMLDPSTIQGYEIEGEITLFHNRDLVDDRDETISEDLFDAFLKKLPVNKIAYEDCFSHKIPLFLGGTDDFSNYQISDIAVYWDMQYQIYMQVKDLPPGTKINSVRFEKREPKI